jgi:hypothetical protein
MSEARNSIQGGGKSSKEREQMPTNVQVCSDIATKELIIYLI